MSENNYKKQLDEMIDIVVKESASDLHLSSGNNPTIRVNGALIPLLKRPKLTKEDTLGFITELLTPEQMESFLKNKEMDFSYNYNKETRFRGNGFFQQGNVGVALRLIPKHIKSLEELNLPPILETFAQKKQGFFLAVGPVGQGKTTTLASMIEIINSNRAEHIVTIEDPIEYIFEQRKSMIDQREVKIDTKDFGTALRSVFRQDVDVLMIGEMRGVETISTAVTAAETGHLVLSTLHTNNAAQTIDRIIDSFPENGQDQIRLQLAASLAGIFSQRLVPRISGGLIPVYELLINNNAIANLIREKRTHEINAVIETSMGEGMVDLNRSLADFVRRGEITIEDAKAHSLNPKLLEQLV
ncbi:MAG: PilT/PilU family type 4a pilus ATPase [Candidatus Pacebacteria bacterium]|jgi:twitching motility protein PilT|nr:PilT/PilU family type 4a pilus ATPase [Candidatus Paceibacterota bacterium]MDP7159574.1 PilT/PilU family type 4a pilus ATPase [Candidatus Paceibacterota bacterium]MDP7366293.1 PilT/PilU family type 4a pilus ATPase [Candidatus Paceibacterota bacterium]MDP7466182.1 PilT/PilU family type 4a pilus ATPase [Candidatus Paceibacterota bacterium]MDP7648482.1 PilT/PilU family type 4a pilus ATPase [Candidatus Paceibacterota bacterium]|tara:strand:- start:1740 stop:2810 length:1071 start_codon:yes stop_codon:yes gene_type:complete